MLGPFNADGERFYHVGVQADTTLCPTLTGFKCTDPALIPVLGPNSVAANSAPAGTTVRRQLGGRIIINPGACQDGTEYASLSDTDDAYCGGLGPCEEWVVAPGWITARIDDVSCFLSFFLSLSPRASFLQGGGG